MKSKNEMKVKKKKPAFVPKQQFPFPRNQETLHFSSPIMPLIDVINYFHQV